jgi:hypothetical protein
MDPQRRARLVWHGAIVSLLGLLAGFPYALVVTGSLTGSERAWRMAHLEGVLNGLLMLAVAGVAGALTLRPRMQSALFWSLVVTGYGNVIASTIAATFAVRGLTPSAPASNLLVYALFMIAVLTVFVAIGIVMVGARRFLDRPT